MIEAFGRIENIFVVRYLLVVMEVYQVAIPISAVDQIRGSD